METKKSQRNTKPHLAFVVSHILIFAFQTLQMKWMIRSQFCQRSVLSAYMHAYHAFESIDRRFFRMFVEFALILRYYFAACLLLCTLFAWCYRLLLGKYKIRLKIYCFLISAGLYHFAFDTSLFYVVQLCVDVMRRILFTHRTRVSLHIGASFS